jgi:hypothetical protein
MSETSLYHQIADALASARCPDPSRRESRSAELNDMRASQERTWTMNGMTKEQQDLVNRILNLAERWVAVLEKDAETRRLEHHAIDAQRKKA